MCAPPSSPAKRDVPTFATLNPMMVDSTRTCGGCYVTVGGQFRLACVDGPESPPPPWTSRSYAPRPCLPGRGVQGKEPRLALATGTPSPRGHLSADDDCTHPLPHAM